MQANNNKTYDVIIIGAGISGIAAALDLKQANVSCLLLEQSHECGGRIKSWYYNKKPVDMGASFAHGIYGHALIEAAKQSKLVFKLIPPSSGVNMDCTTQKKADKNLTSFIDELWTEIRQKMYSKSWLIYKKIMPDVSVLEAYEDLLQNDKDVMDSYRHLIKVFGKENVDRVLVSELSGLAGYYALDQDLLSLGGCMDPEEFHLKGGNHLINIGWQAVCLHLAKPLNIEYNRKVVKIDYTNKNDAHVYVQHGDVQQVYHAKHVICTASIGVLQKQVIQFVPPLSQERQDTINHFVMGELDKAVIVFDKPFWNPGNYFLSLVPEDATDRHFEFLMNLQPVTKEPILVGFVHGRFAKDLSLLPDEQVQQIAMKQLYKMFGEELVNKAKVVAFTYSRWHVNEISYGSYTAVPKGYSAALYDQMASTQDSNDTLFFAGEGCNRKFPGTTHGAFLSGKQVAAHIIALSKN